MEIIKSKNKIILKNAEHFEPQPIFECGQVFRYAKHGENRFTAFSRDKRAEVVKEGGTVVIESGDTGYFENYFDLNRDYSKPEACCQESAVLAKAYSAGKGIRILRQDLTETLFSFIISANNNIRRIQGIIERMCAELGRDMCGWHAFPEVDTLAQAGEPVFARLGAGYRAPYISKTAKKLAGGYDLEALRLLPAGEARAELLRFPGVGPKVADCVLLFGLNRFDVFPVDTWIEKVYHIHFETGHVLRKDISAFFVEKFGENAGIVQQYLFYHQRNGKN